MEENNNPNYFGTLPANVRYDKNLNRRFIGIEKDEKYFNIAKQRIQGTIIKSIEKEENKMLKLPGMWG